MKQETNKTKKQPQTAKVKTMKHRCGTLSYLAECRHVSPKDISIRWAPPPDDSARTIRE